MAREFHIDLDLNAHKVTDLAPGTNGTDAVNKSQLDAVSGSVSTMFQWVYDSVETMADPGSGDVRTDTAAGVPSTQIAFSDLTASGIDASRILASLTVGDIISFQESDNADNWGRYEVASAPVDYGTWWLIPVSLLEMHGAAIAKAQNVLVQFTQVHQASPPPPEVHIQSSAPSSEYENNLLWVDVDDTSLDAGAGSPTPAGAPVRPTYARGWDGTYYRVGDGGLSQSAADTRYVNVTGDSMSGALVVPRVESAATGAVTVAASYGTGILYPNATSQTVTVPTGTIAGDVLVVLNLTHGAGTPVTPSGTNGFTYVGTMGPVAGSGSHTVSQVYTRIADASTLSGATVTFTWPSAYGGVLTMLSLRGVALAGATYAFSTTAGGYSSPAHADSMGSRFLLSVLAVSTFNTGAAGAQIQNTTGETSRTVIADPTSTGTYRAIIYHAQRELADGQSVPITTWTTGTHPTESRIVGALVFTKVTPPLVVDSAGVGTAFGGPITVGSTGATFTGPVTVPNPSANGHAANKQYVDVNSLTQSAADARYVNVTGDTMTGSLALQGSPSHLFFSDGSTGEIQWHFNNSGGNLIIGRYDDNGNWLDDAWQMIRSDGVMVVSHKLWLSDPVPTSDEHATSKQYVDARTPKVTSASTAPSSPAVGDIWIDVS